MTANNTAAVNNDVELALLNSDVSDVSSGLSLIRLLFWLLFWSWIAWLVFSGIREFWLLPPRNVAAFSSFIERTKLLDFSAYVINAILSAAILLLGYSKCRVTKRFKLNIADNRKLRFENERLRKQIERLNETADNDDVEINDVEDGGES